MGMIIWVVLGLIGIGIVLYNGLVSKKILCENSWSQIDIQLKRRYDLIPNLVETVKGYAKHESQTLENVIKARNMAMQAPSTDLPARAQAEGVLTASLRQVFALGESYPDLKANQNFMQLQAEVASTEDLVSSARSGYNAAVSNFNTAVQSFPSNLIASSFGFTNKNFFELNQTESQAVQEVPKVSF